MQATPESHDSSPIEGFPKNNNKQHGPLLPNIPEDKKISRYTGITDNYLEKLSDNMKFKTEKAKINSVKPDVKHLERGLMSKANTDTTKATEKDST